MTDIIYSRAWFDDDSEEWNIEHLWFNEDGTYTTSDCDGNHEPFLEEDGDTVEGYCQDAEKSWIKYAEHCAETGEDPLGEFYVRQTFTKKENWIIWFTDWIGREEHGYCVLDGRHGRGKIYQPSDLPKELAEYLCIKKVGDRYCMEGATMKDIRDSVGYVSASGPRYYMKLKLTYDKPRNAKDIAKEVKAAAQRRSKSVEA